MKQRKKRKITRREFVKQSAGAGMLVASGLASGCATPAKAGRKPAAAGDAPPQYIVIGTGAGGAPLACRLAKAGKSVLLIEAGGFHSGASSTVPAYHPLSTEDDEIAWKFYVEHYSRQERQQNSWDTKYIDGRGVFYPRAGTVGGCTAHNALIALYPDDKVWNDIAQIAQAQGNSAWDPRDMRKYWVRVERNQYTSKPAADPSKIGFNGWLPTELSALKFGLNDPTFFSHVRYALAEDGRLKNFLKLLDGGLADLLVTHAEYDPNRVENYSHRDGIYMMPKTTDKNDHGKRAGTRELINRTLAETGNLKLMTHCLVQRVLFDDQGENRAVGVEFLQGSPGAERLYKADPGATDDNIRKAQVQRVLLAKGGEVIVAGGAFNSPQLLMLSGVGDEAKLRAAGVDGAGAKGRYIHVPGVGLNLQDRYEVGVVSELNHDIASMARCQAGAPNDPCLTDFNVDPENSMYSSNGVVISLIKKSNPKKADPDLVIFGLPGHFRGYYPGWANESYQKNYFTWAVLKGHTSNTAGTVELTSNNPCDTPKINFRYFDDGNGDWRDDVNSVVSGLKLARHINSRDRAPLTGSRLIKREVFPGPGFKTDDDLRLWVMKEAWGHHASCSNKMGNDPDGTEKAVVDSHFRVHKTKNLRVVDASVFPKIPGLFIVVPIFMISEKAADLILQDST
jgi:choline dehydrogenase